ncbi:MAG: polysaccharide biosynthesis protein [Bacteroidetes bacterium]|nr:MAG: polysaccharide biosynthesis protein [Bacteroidota bacterium]
MSFRTRINKLAAETAVYGVSSVFGRLINFLLFPFYSNVFAPDVYGPVIVVYAAFVFLNIIYQYGMEAAYLKYAANSPDADEKTRTFSTAVWSLFLTASLFSACIYFFKAPVGGLLGLEPSHYTLLNFAAGILMLDTLTVVPYAELRLQNKPWRFATVRVAGIVVNVGLNLVFILVMDMGIEAIFLANLIASGTSFILLSPAFRQHFRFQFNRIRFRELLRFGLPFVPGGLGYALSERVNIFFLERMPSDRILELYGSDPAIAALADKAATDGNSIYAEFIVGAYGGMIKLAIILALVVQMFRYAWQPFFLQHADDEDAASLFGRVFTLFTAALLVVFLAVAFLAQELVSIPLSGDRFLIAPAYWIGLNIIPVALLGYIFQGFYYHFSAGVYIQNKTKFFVLCTLAGSAVALGLNILLVPQFGMIAAAWATTSSFAVMAIFLFMLVRRVYPVPYEWGRVFSLIAGAIVLYVLWNANDSLQIWWIELLLLSGYTLVAVFISGAKKIRRN